MELDAVISPEIQEPAMPTEVPSANASPSLLTDESSMAPDKKSSLGADKLNDSTKYSAGMSSLPLAANNSNTVADGMISLEIPELAVRNEPSPDMASPFLPTNIMDSTFLPTNDLMALDELVLPETREFAISSETFPDLASPSLLKNDLITIEELVLPETQELDVLTERPTDMTSTSLPTNDSIILDKALLPKNQEPVSSSEVPPDMASTPLPPKDSNMGLGNGRISPETQELAILISTPQDMDLPSLIAAAPIMASEAVEISTSEAQQQFLLLGTAPVMDFPYVNAGSFDIISEPIGEPIMTSLHDTPEFPFPTEVTPEVPPPSLAANVSIMVLPESNGSEISEIQDLPVSAEVIPDTDSSPLAVVGSEMVSEPIETCSQEIQEPCIPNEASLDKDSISRTEGGSEMILAPTETNLSEIQDVAPLVDPPSPTLMDVEYTALNMSPAPPSISIPVDTLETLLPQFKHVPSTVGNSRKRKSNPANETIQLRIGPNNKCVLAHKNILAKSPFFASLFRESPVNEQPSQAYHFPNFDVYAFATIVYWLYQSNVQSIAEEYKADGVFHTTHMVKVYCLCYELELRSLGNVSIELLGHGYMKNHSAPTIEDMDIAYSQTGDWSALRIYMATWARCRQQAPRKKYFGTVPWDSKHFTALTSKHPDLLKDLEKLCGGTDPAYLKSLDPRYHLICWYHDHRKGELCGAAEKTFETVCNEKGSLLEEPI
jgi:hypothetical protein